MRTSKPDHDPGVQPPPQPVVTLAVYERAEAEYRQTGERSVTVSHKEYDALRDEADALAEWRKRRGIELPYPERATMLRLLGYDVVVE